MSAVINTSGPAVPLRLRNPIVRFFASIRVGLIWLASIILYAAVLSALPQVRGALEMTEMEAFRHWSFVTLIALFATNLIVATLTRIRFNIVNFGVLTVHTGLLLLCGGSIWYFATKIEGDVLLRSPQIELITLGGADSRKVAEFLAAKGQRWSETMPAFGGRVAIEVLKTSGTGREPVREATVRVRIGDQAPREVTLSVPQQPLAAVADRLGVRLRTFPGETLFYDDEAAALHYRKMDQPESERRVAELHGLPLSRERYFDEGYVLRDALDIDWRSKRTNPELRLPFDLAIPTGWFEHWRLPIKLDTPELPFDVEVTGYVPYIRGMDRSAADGGDSEFPAATFTVSFGNTRMRDSVFAADPALALARRANLEFRWVANAEEQQRAFKPLVGQNELTIEVLDPPAKKTITIAEGMTIDVEGTRYKLKVAELAPSWPLMTPGYENARSPVARIDVTNGEKSYNRTVVQRFPHLSQDIDERGVRHRDGPYDPNLKLTYRTVVDGWSILAAGAGLVPQLGVFGLDGKVRPVVLEIGRAATIHTSQGELTFTLENLFERGRVKSLPVIEPLDTRRPGLGREASAIRLKLTGKGAHAGWSDSRWIPFSNYPDLEEFAQPTRVSLPGDSQIYELIYSRLPRPLDATLVPQALTTTFFPGRMAATAWRSDFLVVEGEQPPRAAFVETNQTATVGRYTLFQSGAARDHWSYTVLGVGTREAIGTQLLGCVLVTLGALYAFYVKPVIKRRRAAAAVAEANARRSAARAAVRETAEELVEVNS